MDLEYIKTITGGKFGDCIHYREPNGEDYIVMAGVFFFLLWEWAQEQEWWGEFMDVCWTDGEFAGTETSFLSHYINPDRFANAVYEFLKDSQ
jgi:hypothetical protein